MKILVSCSCSSSLILLKLFSPLIRTVMKYWHSRRRSAPSVCHYIVVLHRQWFISWISQTPSFSSLRVQLQSRGDDHNRRINFNDWLSAVSPRRKFHGRTAKRLKRETLSRNWTDFFHFLFVSVSVFILVLLLLLFLFYTKCYIISLVVMRSRSSCDSAFQETNYKWLTSFDWDEISRSCFGLCQKKKKKSPTNIH